jgi:DNA primase catalytic subunit
MLYTAPSYLDLAACASQTRRMHNTFLVFEFGANEEAAQQARHKLESWRQAFRLDKKLQFKFDRGRAAADGDAASTEKPKAEGKDKTKAESESSDAAASGDVKLLVRLYFSVHEKLSHQRWVDRIPSEEPFKGASLKLVRQDEPGFDSIEEKFRNLE